MPTTQEFLIRRLTDMGQATYDYFAALPDAHYAQPVYLGGDQWTPHEILAHFISAERQFLHSLKEVLAGRPTVPDDFDIQAFNETDVPAIATGCSRADLLAAFHAARAETIALVAPLTDDQLALIGRHPWLGSMRLEEFIKFIYRHNQMHERDIKKAIQLGSPIPEGQAASPQMPPRAA